MRVAVLHWNTSSVGGINTTLETLHKVARDRGDTFHVLESNPQRTKYPQSWRTRRRVRGGDSFIVVDGLAPHHKYNAADSARLINCNYDVVMTSFLCPHPTKAYGDEPLFLDLLRRIKLPLIGYIHDAYFDTYREWGLATAALCEKIVINQPAYAPPELVEQFGVKLVHGWVPFAPLTNDARLEGISRRPRNVTWLPQWKNIKGIHQFYRGLPRLRELGFDVDLYNNGIEYYKLRIKPDWKTHVGQDFFAPAYSGDGEATFHGCVPLPDVAEALCRATYMPDFQGHKAKYEAYLNGSYNHTILEALYYGAIPVVHRNMTKTIPADLVCAVDDLATYPETIDAYNRNLWVAKDARQYVLEHHSAEKLYDTIFK